MRATNKNLTLLSQAEQSALYELPDFDELQRQEYFVFTQAELGLIFSRPNMVAQVYCALQLAYFKAKQIFFRIEWEAVDQEDISFILQQYFSNQAFHGHTITKHEHYTQCHIIADFFGYRLWSKNFRSDAENQAKKIISRDISPQFVVMDLLAFLADKKIIRPGYTTLQSLVVDTLNNERKRLEFVINETLREEEKSALQKLLLKDDVLSELAALKQDAKDFKARMMTAEREKLALIKPLYQTAKMLLPTLNLSKQNIHYYASLAHYYSIHELRKKLAASQTYLYLLCYIWLRYQQLTDNLIDAFCYHLKQFEQESKAIAKEEFYQHQKKETNEQALMRSFASFFIDAHFPDEIHFGKVRKQAFKSILSESELRSKLDASNSKQTKEMDFRWKSISKLGSRFKNNLRSLVMSCNDPEQSAQLRLLI